MFARPRLQKMMLLAISLEERSILKPKLSNCDPDKRIPLSAYALHISAQSLTVFSFTGKIHSSRTVWTHGILDSWRLEFLPAKFAVWTGYLNQVRQSDALRRSSSVIFPFTQNLGE